VSFRPKFRNNNNTIIQKTENHSCQKSWHCCCHTPHNCRRGCILWIIYVYTARIRRTCDCIFSRVTESKNKMLHYKTKTKIIELSCHQVNIYFQVSRNCLETADQRKNGYLKKASLWLNKKLCIHFIYLLYTHSKELTGDGHNITFVTRYKIEDMTNLTQAS
jgi:hypothetical protein